MSFSNDLQNLRGEKLINYKSVAKAKRIVIFQKRSTQSEFLDVSYCGHVTYQIWAWFEIFEGNVNRTNTVKFDAHWTSGASKKGSFEISLATDSNRLAVKFLPP